MCKLTTDNIIWDNCFSDEIYILLDANQLPTYIIDPESFLILYCNPAMHRLLKDTTRGKLCYQALWGQTVPCKNCPVTSLNSENVSSQREFLHPSGRWFLLQTSPLHWQGRDLLQITYTDISEQKQREETLLLRNKESDAVIRQSIKGIIRYDIPTDTAVVNLDRNLNPVDEYTIRNYFRIMCKSALIEQESLAQATSILNDIRSGSESKGYDVEICLDQGERRWSHIDYVLIPDDEGKPYRAVISFYDNTEQRKKELAYQSWNARLNSLMDEYTAYMEVNLNQDLIEAEGRSGSWEQNTGGRRFSDFVGRMSTIGIYVEDVPAFRMFFDRERLMGQFYAGNQEATLEYRAIVDGEPLWYKAELQMINNPFSNDVKALIVYSNIDSEIRERELLARKAERDAMTGLYNHTTIEHLIEQTLTQDDPTRCCFLIIDLDDLRNINSLLGHPEGDRALTAIADSMRAQFGKTDLLGRIGGDEFVALLREVPNEDALHMLISGFMEKINKLRIGPLNDKPFHVSIGGALCTSGTNDFKTLYEQADHALFFAKANGKNAFHLYKPGLEQRELRYQPSSTATLSNTAVQNSDELKKLVTAMSTIFPLVISVNLTRNTYYMLEYKSYATQRATDDGCFDQLIEDGAASFHPEDRASFRRCFKREHLLQAYQNGKHTVEHTGRQLGDDGVYRTVHTVVILMREEGTGDICELTFSRILSE